MCVEEVGSGAGFIEGDISSRRVRGVTFHDCWCASLVAPRQVGSTPHPPGESADDDGDDKACKADDCSLVGVMQ